MAINSVRQFHKAASVLAGSMALLTANSFCAYAQHRNDIQPKSAEKAHVDRPAEDPQIAALVRLLNDNSVKNETANLKHIQLLYDKTGKPIRVVLLPKSDSSVLSHLKTKLNTMHAAEASAPVIARARRIDIDFLEPNLKQEKGVGLASR